MDESRLLKKWRKTDAESKRRLAMRLKLPFVPSASAEKMSLLCSAKIFHSSPDKSAFHEAGSTSSKFKVKLIICFPQFLSLFCLPVARISLSSSVRKVKWMPLISNRGDDLITACVVFMMVIPPLLPNTWALFNHFSKLIPIDFFSSFFFF